MLIYNENEQFKRAESINSLLEQKDLCGWAKSYWSRTLLRLAKGQVQLEYNFTKPYKNV